MSKNNQKMTIKDLARKMDQGFQMADQKMDQGFQMADQKMDQGFQMADQRMDDIAKSVDALAAITKEGFDAVDKRFVGVDKRFVGVDKRLTKIEATMVTKSYLDDRLADLEGGVIARQRKEDKKLNLLIEFLKKKKILGKEEIKMLKEYQIFPQLASLKPERYNL